MCLLRNKIKVKARHFMILSSFYHTLMFHSFSCVANLFVIKSRYVFNMNNFS